MRARAFVVLAVVSCSCSRSSPPPPAAPPLVAPAAVETGFPGAAHFDPALTAKLGAALAAKGKDYLPRTEHRLPGGAPKYTNRLILEPSPYLLQHAHNPVSWFAWGDEPFERARAEHKPVFLSVGYSTCHWCHVMERESFENEEIARYLNQHYVCIKVDREERPDLDGAYMTAVQALTGSGGWPMSVWLTPSREPFFGGTYFPPVSSRRGKGFLEVLTGLQEQFAKDPAGVAGRAQRLVALINEQEGSGPGMSLGSAASLRSAAAALTAQADGEWGGFGRAPKFPRPSALQFLLRYSRRSGDASARDHALLTLDRMAQGGLHDQLAGGFHRYSTDRTWLVPHFEKMLYDNALLVLAYLEGSQISGRRDLVLVAADTLDYLDRELRDPSGGFYSATDADSEEVEGKFFVWTLPEFDTALGPLASPALREWFGVTAAGNFEGKNILTAREPTAAVARRSFLEEASLEAQLRRARAVLLAQRNRRVKPHLDDKILAAWNGLTLSAFARGALVLREPRYLERAEALATFLLTRMTADGKLLASFRGGAARLPAYLDDYAFVIQGLLDLHEASFDARWLKEALRLQAVLDEGFADPKGGYFFTSLAHEKLLARQKPGYDGALPAGNSVAALNLLRLGELTGDRAFSAKGEATLSAFAEILEKSPSALPAMLAALDFLLDRPKQIVVKLPEGKTAADAEPLLSKVRGAFLPNRTLLVGTGDASAALTPALGLRPALKGLPTAYVCEGTVCGLPTTDPAVLEKQLARVAPLGK